MNDRTKIFFVIHYSSTLCTIFLFISYAEWHLWKMKNTKPLCRPLFVCPSVHLFISWSVCLSISFSFWLSICLSHCLSVCQSVRLSVCQSVSLSVECHFDDYHYYVRHFAECHYSECCYAHCLGTVTQHKPMKLFAWLHWDIL